MIQKLLKPLVNAAVEPLVKLAEKAGAAMGLALGLMVFVVAIALGVVIPHHVGGVMLAALGAASGTVLMSAAASRLFRQPSSATVDDRDAEQSVKLRRELNEQRDLVHALRRKQDDSEAEVKELKKVLEKREEESLLLAKDVHRLERQRINVDEATPVLRLQLISVPVRMRDFIHEHFSKDHRRKSRPGESRGDYEFLGLFETSCTVNLGVDLTKVRLVETERELIVAGLQPNFQGIEHRKDPWSHREVRVRGIMGGLSVEPDHPKLADLMETYRAEIGDRLNEGVDFKYLENEIVKRAEAFLRSILWPLGKPVRFVREPSDGSGRSLEDFIRNHNSTLEVQITERLEGSHGARPALPEGKRR